MPAPIVKIEGSSDDRKSINPGRKTGLFLACPTASGKMNFTIGMGFGRAMASQTLPECPFRFTIHVEVQKRPVDYARNMIVKAFMESDDDWLVMVDEDQILPDNWWHLCTVSDADIVGALTPVWVSNMDPETMLRVNNYGVDDQNRCYNLPAPDDSVKQPYRVPIVGTGLIAIRRRVFAPKPSGLGDSPFYFTFMDDRKIRGGEDVNFSVDANRAGFTLAVHPGVRSDHLKEIPLSQVESYYRARKAAELAGKEITPEQRVSIG